MRSLSRKSASLLAALLLAASGAVGATERLVYRAELNSLLTLFNWAHVGTVTVTSEDSDGCPGGGVCRQIEAWMSSEAAPALETIYPLRYLYRTAYRPDRFETLAFEELRNRHSGTARDAYPWRHRVIWLEGGEKAATRYDVDGNGQDLPEQVAAWVKKDMAGGLALKLENSREIPMTLPALDRLGGLAMLRGATLASGVSWTQAGAGPKGSLTFVVTIEGQETVEAAQRRWDTWKIRVEERRGDKDDADPAPLYAWIADDAARTPVRFSIDHAIGRVRLTLN